MLQTDRLILRKWTEEDADSLFAYASAPDIGPAAGWRPVKSREEGLDVIRGVLTGAQCYAICEKGSDRAIWAIELKLSGHTAMTKRDDECELAIGWASPSGDAGICRRRQGGCFASDLRSWA